jgi:hypothetical protein
VRGRHRCRQQRPVTANRAAGGDAGADRVRHGRARCHR